MDRVFKRRKRFFFSLLSVVFLYTANRPDEMNSFNFFNYHKRDVCTQASVCTEDKSVYSGGHIWRKQWAPDGVFYPGGYST